MVVAVVMVVVAVVVAQRSRTAQSLYDGGGVAPNRFNLLTSNGKPKSRRANASSVTPIHDRTAAADRPGDGTKQTPGGGEFAGRPRPGDGTKQIQCCCEFAGRPRPGDVTKQIQNGGSPIWCLTFGVEGVFGAAKRWSPRISAGSLRRVRAGRASRLARPRRDTNE